jgi:metal-responsive CopG/Arc/MetJ family transcriptional regulator
MAKKKSQRGGYRPGAGRKPRYGERMVETAVTLPGAVLEILDQLAEDQSKSRSGLIIELLMKANESIRDAVRQLEESSMHIVNLIGERQKLASLQTRDTLNLGDNRTQAFLIRILQRRKDRVKVQVAPASPSWPEEKQIACRVLRNTPLDGVVLERIEPTD